MEKITAAAEKTGERIDALLPHIVPDLTRSAAQKLVENGAVLVNGAPVRKNYKSAAGDVIEIELPDPEPIELTPQDIPLDVVYEDADVIVVNKPRGMVVHPAPGHSDGTLVNALLYHCGDSLSGIGGEKRPGIVHRIDMDTSGLIIAAKNDAFQRAATICNRTADANKRLREINGAQLATIFERLLADFFQTSTQVDSLQRAGVAERIDSYLLYRIGNANLLQRAIAKRAFADLPQFPRPIHRRPSSRIENQRRSVSGQERSTSRHIRRIVVGHANLSKRRTHPEGRADNAPAFPDVNRPQRAAGAKGSCFQRVRIPRDCS